MSGAFDHTFQAPIPGSSIAHHKLGSMPHEQPPKFVDPDEALNYFFKLLTQPKIQRQIWDILRMPGSTVFAIARAILFKAALDGIIQMNLGIIIYPTVEQMIYTIAKVGGIDAKMHPDITTPQREKYIKDNLKQLIAKYDTHGWLTGSPLQPKPAPQSVQSPEELASEGEGQPDDTQGGDDQSQLGLAGKMMNDSGAE